MTRLAVAAALLLSGITTTAHAQTDDTTTAAAAAHGVDPEDVAGALNTLHAAGIDVDAETYLTPTPVATQTAPISNGWPIDGALGQRIYCIEGIESHHGVAMWNPTPVHGEHAQGYLGWLPSTARSVGVVIGSRASEWSGAARMLALGRGGEFYGVHAGIC